MTVTLAARQQLVDLRLVRDLRVLALDGLHLQSDINMFLLVEGQEDLAEAAAADPFFDDKAVVDHHAVLELNHGRHFDRSYSYPSYNL